MKAICSVSECSSFAVSKGWCGKHYQRWCIHGDPTFVKLVKGLTVAERLDLNKLEVQRDYDTLCWEYQGSLDKDGYGKVSVKGQWVKAHRLAYMEFVGPIPEGIQVLHKCDNPKCFRPDHLFLGSNQENTADRVAKDRSAKGSSGGNSKLTEEQVIEILTAPKTRGMRGLLAIKFKVSKSNIDMILKGKAWKHVSYI